jgi:hypothetical protein
MYDEYCDYHSLASNCEELYSYDDDHDYDDGATDTIEWENYYHNVADELIDE